MDDKQIFLIRYKELEDCITNQSKRNMLDLPLVLRQILLEGLMDFVNKDYRLEIEFEVGLSVEERDEEMESLGLPIPDGLHFLGMFPPNELKKRIKTREFLKFKTVSYQGTYFSVKELIDVCANKLGGVHIDRGEDNATTLKIRELGKILNQMGLPSGVFSTLIIIGNIVFEALSDLDKLIQKS